VNHIFLQIIHITDNRKDKNMNPQWTEMKAHVPHDYRNGKRVLKKNHSEWTESNRIEIGESSWWEKVTGLKKECYDS